MSARAGAGTRRRTRRVKHARAAAAAADGATARSMTAAGSSRSSSRSGAARSRRWPPPVQTTTSAAPAGSCEFLPQYAHRQRDEDRCRAEHQYADRRGGSEAEALERLAVDEDAERLRRACRPAACRRVDDVELAKRP